MTYTEITFISTVDFFPDITEVAIDRYIYGNEAYFVSLFNAFDGEDLRCPLLTGGYAAIQRGGNTNGQVGAHTFSMALAEAIFLVECERNSDIIFNTSYGALIENYNEAPDTVAVIKQTKNQVLLTMSYYVQQLFATYHGSASLPVTARDGRVPSIGLRKGLEAAVFSRSLSTNSMVVLAMSRSVLKGAKPGKRLS